MSSFGADIFDEDESPPAAAPRSEPAAGGREPAQEIAFDRKRGRQEDPDDLLSFASPPATPEHRAPEPEAAPDEPAWGAPRARAGRGDRAERSERGERAERGERPERSERAERGGRGEASERGERGERGERAQHGERSERGEGRERFERPETRERYEPRERPERPERAERHEPRERHERPERLDAPPSAEPRSHAHEVAGDEGEGEARGRREGRHRRRRRHEGSGAKPWRRDAEGRDRPETADVEDAVTPAEPSRTERPAWERGRGGRHGSEAAAASAPARRSAPALGEGRAESAAPAVGQRIAILLDVADLLQQARRQGAEISYGRLLRHLAGDRLVIRAVAYVPPGEPALESALAAHQIEVERCPDAAAVGVAVAVDALAQAAKVDCIVLASASKGLTPLARALRSHGLRVESASFVADAPWPGPQHHRLGQSCLFVP